MQGGHLADPGGEGGVKGVKSSEDGTCCDESGGDPDHGPDGSVKDAQFLVVEVLPDGREFEIVPLEGEDVDIVEFGVVEAKIDGRKRVTLGKGGKVVAIEPGLRFEHGARSLEDPGDREPGLAEGESFAGGKIVGGNSEASVMFIWALEFPEDICSSPEP